MIGNFDVYATALFEFYFEPYYGDYVFCDTSFEKMTKLIIWTEEYEEDNDEDRDWIVQLNYGNKITVTVNTNHPYYEEIEEDITEYVSDIQKHIE